jgi:hypothetical protein
LTTFNIASVIRRGRVDVDVVVDVVVDGDGDGDGDGESPTPRKRKAAREAVQEGAPQRNAHGGRPRSLVRSRRGEAG